MNETKKIWAECPEWARIVAITIVWCVGGAALWGIAKADVMEVFTNLWIVSGLALIGAAATILAPWKKED